MSGRERLNKVTVAVLQHCLHRCLHHHLYQAFASSLTSTSLSPSATSSLSTSSPLGGPQTASFTSATCYHEGCSSEQLSACSSSFLWGTRTIFSPSGWIPTWPTGLSGADFLCHHQFDVSLAWHLLVSVIGDVSLPPMLSSSPSTLLSKISIKY